MERSGSRRPFVAAKDLLWLVYLYPLRLLAAILPIPIFRVLGGLIDPLVQQQTSARKRLILRHLEAAERCGPLPPDLPAVASGVISGAVRRSIDDLILNKLATDPLNCSGIIGLEHLQNTLAQGGGAIVLSGHFYATRIAKRHLERLGYPMLSVRNGQPPDAMMGRLGERFLHRRYIEHLHGVIRDEVYIQDPDCALNILRRLRSNGIVHIYLDAGVSSLRSPDEDAVRYRSSFVGGLRPFASRFLRIAAMADSAVIPMACFGDSRSFSIAFDAPLDLSSDSDPQQLVADHMPKFIADLDSAIRKRPEQWELWGVFEEGVLHS